MQKPHPPLWYGVATPDGAVWAAQHGINTVANAPAKVVRGLTDRYRAEWAAAGKSAATLPLLGMNRHLVVADTDAEAMALARRAYGHWHTSFFKLWRKHGTVPSKAAYPDTFDELQAMGTGLAGSPTTVRDALLSQVAEAGNTYLVSRLAFGDLTLAESTHSLDLFAREVMPALTAMQVAAE